ncbi:hypothetical protein [Colwellia sp. E2M01]|uniref:hypothetical protein n=1 Tax=Colwellia sp. E2M01 TaxID=2841561 RepID=UPI001C09F388|nr:hypothetical protein [Colwellia sp. E2M01]MBU2871051.1 hypothetical protein [Colwellia sp. E2M01]
MKINTTFKKTPTFLGFTNVIGVFCIVNKDGIKERFLLMNINKVAVLEQQTVFIKLAEH